MLSMSSWRNRRPTTPLALDEGDEELRRWPRSPRLGAKPTCRRRSMRCRCMAASASPGTTTPISVKRAKSSEILFGDANEHRER